MKRRRSAICVYLICVSFFAISCANQLPPSGGADDKIPPKILSVYPRPGTLNFKSQEILFKFDEYVDKRSFAESFSIYPEPAGKSEISWSGKDALIKFERSLAKNTTYVINIGRDLKDLRGGNALPAPAVFAFSTGSKIDSGSISGKISALKMDRIKLLLFRLSTNEQPDPTKQKADYIIQPNDNGDFVFAYLPAGKYRLFGLYDDDRNSFFSEDFDIIAVTASDYTLAEGEKIKNVQVNMVPLISSPADIEFLNRLMHDSSGNLSSNIISASKPLSQSARIYFNFGNIRVSKEEVSANLSLTDSSTGKTYRPVLNWFNDSLLEIFTSEKFAPGSQLQIKLKAGEGAKSVELSKTLTIADSPPSTVSGRIRISGINEFGSMNVLLSPLEKTAAIYKSKINEDGTFAFRNVSDGTYRLIVFEDSNDNGIPDEGSINPFKHSEKVWIYSKEINATSGWNVEDILIDY